MDGRRLIDADDFVEWLLADAITDDQRQFAEKVRYAAEKMPTVDAVPVGRCEDCARNADNGGLYDDGRTRCPIQEHYYLPRDGFCHLWEKRKDGEQHGE